MEQKPSWEQEAIARFLVIAFCGVLVGLVGLGLWALTGLECFGPMAGVGFVVAVAFGMFGLAGLAVEGW